MFVKVALKHEAFSASFCWLGSLNGVNKCSIELNFPSSSPSPIPPPPLSHSSPPPLPLLLSHFQIYQSSLAYGPHATQTSGGYYHLGKVFLHESKPDVAISLHDQVSGGWMGGGSRGKVGGGSQIIKTALSVYNAVLINATNTIYCTCFIAIKVFQCCVFSSLKVVAIWHTHLSGLVQGLHHAYTSDSGATQTRMSHTDGTRGIPSPPTLGTSFLCTRLCVWLPVT